MTVAAVAPIVPAKSSPADTATKAIKSSAGSTPVVASAPATGARVEGAIARVVRRGRGLVSFDGTNLRKTGRGEVASVSFEGSVYRGELVAISPKRAILHVSACRSDHGVARA